MWRNVNRVICWGLAFNSARMLVGAISIVFLLGKGLSISEIGQLKSLQAAIILFFSIPLSYLSDKFSRKLSLAASALLGAGWLFITGVAESKWLFFVAEMMNAVSLALFNGVFISFLVGQSKLLDDTLESKVVISRYYKFESIGIALAALLGAWIADINSNLPWLVSAVLVIVIFLSSFYILPKDVKYKKYRLLNDYKYNSHNEAVWRKDISKIIEIILRSREIQYQMLLMVLISFYIQVVIHFWQPIISYSSNRSSGIAYGIAFTCIMLSQATASHFVSQRIAERKFVSYLKYMLVLCVPVAFIYKGADNDINLMVQLIAVIMIFFGARLLFDQINGSFHDVIVPQYRSTFDSIMSAANRLCVLTLFPLMSMGVDFWGNIIFTYTLISISILLIILLSNSRRKA